MKKILITTSIAISSIMFYSFSEINQLFGIQQDKLKDTTEVKATIYWGYKKLNTTADGFKFKATNGGEHKIIAVSRDLLKVYPLGTKVIVLNAGVLDGVYTVKDKMGKQWKKKIDILVNRNYELVSFKNVQLIKVLPDFPLKEI